MPAYLARLARQAYQRRNEALAKLTTQQAIAGRQAWIRDTFWKLAGGKPEPCAPNTRVTGELQRAGYKIEKLVYESQPGLHVSANLYTPAEGSGPYPGVLFQMGHSPNGKAAEPYQKCCQALARLGYIVLAFDPMGQGERIYIQNAGHSLSADDQHTIPGKRMLLVGDTATRMQTWDAVVSLNILASHPKVDARRLASTGQSGGGTLTMFLAAVDERLAAAAVSSGNTENFACADYNAPGSVDDAEQNLIGSGPLGFDRWDTLYPLAPRPLLVMASTRDFFGTYSPSYLRNGHEEFAKLKNVYETLGAPYKLSWYQTDLPHALSKDMRLQIYSFFERELKGSSRPVTEEPAVQAEPDQNLYAGKTGSVVRDFGSTTPFQMAKRRADALRPSGKLGWLDLRAPKNPAVRILGKARAERSSIETWEIESEPGVWLPCFVWMPATPTSTLLVLEPNGRTAHWREGDLYHRLAAQNIQVVAFDVRCIGDLSPEVGRGNPHYTRERATEDAYAWASFILGRSLLEQRITDIITVVRAAKREIPLTLAARGHLTIPARFAAAMESGLQRVYVSGAPTSFWDEQKESFVNSVPGILSRTDIPHLGSRQREGNWTFENLLQTATLA